MLEVKPAIETPPSEAFFVPCRQLPLTELLAIKGPAFSFFFRI
jgi:hypothetical protein